MHYKQAGKKQIVAISRKQRKKDLGYFLSVQGRTESTGYSIIFILGPIYHREHDSAIGQ